MVATKLLLARKAFRTDQHFRKVAKPFSEFWSISLGNPVSEGPPSTEKNGVGPDQTPIYGTSE